MKIFSNYNNELYSSCLGLPISLNLEIKQLDVKTGFLHEDSI